LQIAQLNIFNIDSKPLVYNTDFTVDINTTPKTWDNNNLAFDFSKMFDNDPTTSCYSGSWFGPNESAVELSITFNDISGVHIGGIYIKNRMECCWRRINAFTLHVYDIHNNKLASEPLTHPYLTSYPRFTTIDDFKQNHLTDNAVMYIVTKPYIDINAGALTVGYNSVEIKSNMNGYTYLMGNSDNSKMHILNIPNYMFVAGETYVATFTCYTDVSGVSNNTIFGYQSRSGKIYYTSPVLGSEPRTYISTLLISENGLVYIYVNAPGNSVLHFTNFSIEQKKTIITLPTNNPDYDGYLKSVSNIVNGNDIIKYSNYNMEQCRQACDNTPDCVAFVKGINTMYDNGCWLKYNTDSKNRTLNDNNLIMYEKNTSNATPSPTIYVSSNSGLNLYGVASVTPSITPSATPSITPSITPSATPSATPSTTPSPSVTL
jgi:hypothetical protein